MKKKFLIIIIIIFTSIFFISSNKNEIFFSLETAYATALAEDNDLKQLKYQLKTAELSENDLYLGFIPSINISASNNNSTNYGSKDSESYNLSFKLNQPIYKQFQTFVAFDQYDFKIKQLKVQIDLRKRKILEMTYKKFAKISGAEANINHTVNQLDLKKKLAKISKTQYNLGIIKELDYMQVEQELIDLELSLLKQKQELDLEYENLKKFLGLKNFSGKIIISKNINYLLSEKFGIEISNDNDKIIKLIMEFKNKLNQKNIYDIAYSNNLDIKKNDLSFKQLLLQKKLIDYRFLQAINLSLGVSFTGDKFMPVNPSFSFSISFSLNFGFFSSNISKSNNVSSSGNSSSTSVSGSGIKTLVYNNPKQAVLIQMHQLALKEENLKNSIKSSLKIWNLKIDHLYKKYQLLKKKENIMNRKEKILKLQYDLGKVKDSDIVSFSIEKESFKQNITAQYYSFIDLLIELEGILNTDLSNINIEGLKNEK